MASPLNLRQGSRAETSTILRREAPLQTAASLKCDNHFLPACYQRGFTDSSGRVWVKFAGQEEPEHRYPRSVGKQKDLYVRSTGGVEDDKFENFFSKEIENDFARLSQRIKKEQNQLLNLTGKELGALGIFVASQAVRTLANKQCMEEQVGRPLNTNEFLDQMGKQAKAIISSWGAAPPGFHFYTSLPYVGEHFITGDNPVVLEVTKIDNPASRPRDEPQLAITSIQEILNNPAVSFEVALSPCVCVFLRGGGGGEAHLRPRTMEPSELRRFNAFIREQCKLFTLARDKESLT
jgi:Protein of unknown function (DUF4238)